MSPGEYLRFLRTPDESRWKPMLVALALFAVGAGAAVQAQASALVSMGLTALALAAWVVGGCALIGYVRWYFRSEAARVLEENKSKVDSRKSKGASGV